MTDRPSTGPVQYKGDDLDSERGPGLGCFRFQLGLLVFLVVLTPLSVAWQWPDWLSAVLLFAVLILLLFAGQTSSSCCASSRPIGGAGGARSASATKTVGELEDEGGTERRRRPTAEPSADRRRTPCDNRRRVPADRRLPRRIELAVPVLATFFSVRRGRDPFFKFFMRTVFPRQVSSTRSTSASGSSAGTTSPTAGTSTT